MANPTTNYGFVLPTATDLVTDLPADFDVALQGVDTRLKALQPGTTLGDLAYSSATANTNTRLPVGTNGQVLAVVAGVPAWQNGTTGDIEGVTAGVGISGGGTSGTVTVTNDMATTITAAGDIVVGTGSGTYDNLPIGTTAQVLTADTTVSPYKVKWATPTSGTPAIAEIASGSLTSGTQLQLSSLSSYDTLIFRITGLQWSVGSDNIYMRINNSSSSIYDQVNGLSFGEATYASYNQYSTGNAFFAVDQGLKRDALDNSVFLVLTNCKAAGFTTGQATSGGRNANNFDIFQTSNFIFKSAAAVSSIELFTSSSRTFSAGDYVLWGA